MERGKKAWAQVEGAGLALLADVPLYFGSQSKDTRMKIGLGLWAVVILGLCVLVYWLTKPVEVDQGTDYAAGFEASCVPGATRNFLDKGVDNDQAAVQATAFCECVATAVSENVSPDAFAEVERTRKMPRALILAIGTAAKTCE